MFKSHLRTAFRNFWKNRRYSIVNILGLALSLTCFILVVLYVQHQYSYDRWNPAAERVYQVNINYGNSDTSTDLMLKADGKNAKSSDIGTTTPAGLAPLLKERIPEIQAVNRINMGEWREGLISLSNNNQQYIKNIIGVDSSFFQVFPYPFLYGQVNKALNGPRDMVLSYETSEKLFGNENPVGKVVRLDHDQYYTITGVMDKQSIPSSIPIGALLKSQNTNMPWGYKWYFTYVLLRPDVSSDAVATKMDKVLYESPAAKEVFGQKKAQILLTPFTSLYLHPASDNQPGHVGNPQALSILLLMGLLILFVSCVNFTNLAIAQAGGRAREVGVKKVLGSTKIALALQFIAETFLQCLLSIFIALVVSELLLPVVNQQLGISLALAHPYPSRLAIYLLTTLVGVTLLSGAYPAFFLSGYQPAKVLKGNFSRGNTGSFLRKGLVMFQFLITAGFIIAILIVNKQFQFLKFRDVGFDPKQVMDIRIHDGKTKRSFSFIKQRLLQLNHVEDVTRVSNQPGSHSMEHSEYSDDNISMEFDEVHIDYDYFKTLGVPLLAGREFSPQYASDSNNIILNESAAKRYHLMDSIGSILSPLKGDLGTVKLVGVVRDYNQRGADSKIQTMAFFMNGYSPGGLESDDRNHILIRMDLSGIEQTVNDIKSIWREAEPDYPIQYSFLDQQFTTYLSSTISLGKLVSIFTLCALLITLFGLFSLATLTAAQRTKEIGIRMVLGAGMKSIIILLNRQFIGLILLANLAAWPLCYVFISKWLDNYNYRITIPVWPFGLAMLITFVLCIIIVSLQAWKAVRANPVEALKYE